MIDDVLRAQQALDDAKKNLETTVLEARANGHTWQQIGDTLGMSRQAAFKRFGRPADPSSDETTVARRSVSEVTALTERVFASIAVGDYRAVHSLMTDDTAAALTAERIADTWRQVLAEVGEFERCDHTRVEFPDGTVVGHGDEVLGVVIGATEVVCEAGTSIGRVAVDGDDRIIGLLIAPEGTTDVPF